MKNFANNLRYISYGPLGRRIEKTAEGPDDPPLADELVNTPWALGNIAGGGVGAIHMARGGKQLLQAKLLDSAGKSTAVKTEPLPGLSMVDAVDMASGKMKPEFSAALDDVSRYGSYDGSGIRSGDIWQSSGSIKKMLDKIPASKGTSAWANVQDARLPFVARGRAELIQKFIPKGTDSTVAAEAIKYLDNPTAATGVSTAAKNVAEQVIRNFELAQDRAFAVAYRTGENATAKQIAERIARHRGNTPIPKVVYPGRLHEIKDAPPAPTTENLTKIQDLRAKGKGNVALGGGLTLAAALSELVRRGWNAAQLEGDVAE